MKKLELVVEDNNGMLEGYIEGVKSNSLISSSGKTIDGLIKKLRLLIKMYQAREGKNDKAWQRINAQTVEFDITHAVSR